MSTSTEKVVFNVGAGLVLLAVVGAFVYGTRWFSQAVTPINIVDYPERGVSCAQIITSDGAAIDCWRTQP